MTIIEFSYEMKKLISLYRTHMDEAEIKSWYDRFANIDKDVLERTINNMKNKIMPNAIELQELCEQESVNISFEILDLMWRDGYFKKSDFGELSPEQQSRNFDKAMMWLNTGVIPEWFKRDMDDYKVKQLPAPDVKKIGEKDGRTNLQLPNN